MSEYGVRYGALLERKDKITSMVFQKTHAIERQLEAIAEKYPDIAKEVSYRDALDGAQTLRWYVQEMD